MSDTKWTDAMQRGDFMQAWQISDEELRAPSPQSKHGGERHLQRIWHGEQLAGQRVLVRCYHGLGDTIQFIRFAPALCKEARQVIVWVQPELLALVSAVDGVDVALPLHDGKPDVDFDVDIEIMELAHALRADATMVSQCVPYLRAAPHGDARIRLVPRKIGLVWEAGGWDQRRSVPPHLLGALVQDTKAAYYSLQQGPGRREGGSLPAIDVAVEDIYDLASLIMQFDLVITVDTMVAHLAGALGAQVWTMLHSECDWRWSRTGAASIWYPTMRLFRQERKGDWHSVITCIKEELRERSA